MTRPHSRINWELIISGIALAGSVMYFGIQNEHRHTVTENNIAAIHKQDAAEMEADKKRDEEIGLLRTAVIDLLEDKKKREGSQRRKSQSGLLEQMKQRQKLGPQGNNMADGPSNLPRPARIPINQEK